MTGPIEARKGKFTIMLHNTFDKLKCMYYYNGEWNNRKYIYKCHGSYDTTFGMHIDSFFWK